jgi:acetoin utilization protein AcuB
MTVAVRALMTEDPITIAPDTRVIDAHRRMQTEAIRHLPVCVDGHLVGIVTDRDIRLNLPSPATSLSIWEVHELLSRVTVEQIMTRAVILVGPDRDVAEAARIMIDHKIGALLVMEGDRIVGILTEADFVRAMVTGRSAGPPPPRRGAR